MMIFFCDIIFIFYAVIMMPVLLLQGKWHGGLLQRLGFWPERPVPNERPAIWVHAVSVGEVLIAQSFIETILKERPDERIVLSVTTKTGHALAQSRAQGRYELLWSPMDLSFVVLRFIDRIRPRVYIATETEIWPNLFYALAHANVPIAIINGRISDKAFSRYLWIKPLLRRILSHVCIFCMQSQQDAQRIIAMGAVPARVKDVGNIKFDQTAPATLEPMGDKSHLYFVGGSTHPGEEKILLNVFLRSRTDTPALRLVLAPRHPARAAKVAQEILQAGLNPRYLSRQETLRGPDDVLLVDVIGRLMPIYQQAVCVFMGKSLTVGGGHNIIEPAMFGKPVIFGPHMQNFKDVASVFLAHTAAIQVKNAVELEDMLKKILANSPEVAGIGSRALAVIEQQRGALARTLNHLKNEVDL